MYRIFAVMAAVAVAAACSQGPAKEEPAPAARADAPAARPADASAPKAAHVFNGDFRTLHDVKVVPPVKP